MQSACIERVERIRLDTAPGRLNPRLRPGRVKDTSRNDLPRSTKKGRCKPGEIFSAGRGVLGGVRKLPGSIYVFYLPQPCDRFSKRKFYCTGTDQGAWRKILEMERKQVGEGRAQPVTRPSRPLAA